MRILEEDYDWSRAAPREVEFLEDGIAFLESYIKIYRIYGTGHVLIYADEELQDLIYEGEFPYEPEVPFCVDRLCFICNETSKVQIICEMGKPKMDLTPYLDTTEGMEVISASYNDDGTYTLAGLDGFFFNGLRVDSVFVNSNHWIGLGSNAQQMNIMNRDGCSTGIYRQEIVFENDIICLKIRFEGYTVYHDQGNHNRLIYELFLFSNNDMFLYLVRTPTSENTGTSNINCGGISSSLALVDTTGQGLGKDVSFYHLDAEGKTWDIQYQRYEQPGQTSTRAFLIQTEEGFFTVMDGVAVPLAIETPTAADFYEYGVSEPPASELLLSLPRPKVLYWEIGVKQHQLMEYMKALPYPRSIRSVIDMRHPSILGIMLMTAQYSGNVTIQYSVDNEESYSDEMPMEEWLTIDLERLWEALQQTRILYLKYILHDGDALSRFKITYQN